MIGDELFLTVTQELKNEIAVVYFVSLSLTNHSPKLTKMVSMNAGGVNRSHIIRTGPVCTVIAMHSETEQLHDDCGWCVELK